MTQQRMNGDGISPEDFHYFEHLFQDASTPIRPNTSGHTLFDSEAVNLSHYLCGEVTNLNQMAQVAHMAREQSQRGIDAAPNYYFDLPWDEIRDYQCSMEELIIFFPNHVLRWPILALSLRRTNWDRLFQRVAYFVNLSRESTHFGWQWQHLDALTCKFKVERAIKEIEPSFSMDPMHNWTTNWEPQVDGNFLDRNVTTRPKSLSRRENTTVSLLDAASYVKNNPFFRRPFSRYVRTKQAWVNRGQIENWFVLEWEPQPLPFDPPRHAQRTEPHPPRATQNTEPGHRENRRDDNPAPESSHNAGQDRNQRETHPPPPSNVSDSQRLCPHGSIDNCDNAHDCPFIHTEDLPAHAQPEPSGRQQSHPPPQRNTPSRTCRLDPECPNRSCIFEHPQRDRANQSRDQNQNRDRRQEQGTAGPSSQLCRDGLRCRRIGHGCPYDHSMPRPQDIPDRTGLCRRDTRCRNPQCQRGHRNMVTPADAQLRQAIGEWCERSSFCTIPNCEMMHPSPAMREQLENSDGGPNRDRGDTGHRSSRNGPPAGRVRHDDRRNNNQQQNGRHDDRRRNNQQQNVRHTNNDEGRQHRGNNQNQNQSGRANNNGRNRNQSNDWYGDQQQGNQYYESTNNQHGRRRSRRNNNNR